MAQPQAKSHQPSLVVHPRCSSVMEEAAVDRIHPEELRNHITKLKSIVRKERNSKDGDQGRSESSQNVEQPELNNVGGFGGRNTGKPDPWDGDTEQGFKRFATCMANAGDKLWRKNTQGVADHGRRR